jgi:hypothetical protein
MNVLGLAYERPILQLFDLKTKKLFEFSQYINLNPIGHDLAKLITKGFISRTKNDIINIYLAHK